MHHTLKTTEANTLRGNLYGVCRGVYTGEMLAYIDADEDSINFLSLPKMIKRSVPTTSFFSGIKDGIVELIETLPDDVYKVVLAQYESITV